MPQKQYIVSAEGEEAITITASNIDIQKEVVIFYKDIDVVAVVPIAKLKIAVDKAEIIIASE